VQGLACGALVLLHPLSHLAITKHSHAPATAPTSVAAVPSHTPYSAPAPTLSGVVVSISGVPSAVNPATHTHPSPLGTAVSSQCNTHLRGVGCRAEGQGGSVRGRSRAWGV